MISEHEDKYRKIGLKIAFYRKKQGYTQQQLADNARISKSYLSKIESSNTIKSFSLDALFSIAEALNIDIVDLLNSK